MAAIMRSLCFCFVILACSSTLFTVADAWRFNVGGNGVWAINPKENYKSWAERNRFQVNDTLYFKYAKGSDSVQEVMKADFDGCNIRNPIKKFDDGESVFTLDQSGPFYFISGNEDHCKKGQKLIVVVLAIRNHTTNPISPAKPPKSPSPLSPLAPAKPPKSHPPVSQAKPPSDSQPPKSSVPSVSPTHSPKSSPSDAPSRSPAKSPASPTPSPKSHPPSSPAKPPSDSQPPKSSVPSVSPTHSPKFSPSDAPSHSSANPPASPTPSPKSPPPASAPSPSSNSPDHSPTSSPPEQTPPFSPSPSETTPTADNITAPAPSHKKSASRKTVASVMPAVLSVAFTVLFSA